MNRAPLAYPDRTELGRAALCAITGLAGSLLDLVRTKNVDSLADVHHAALAMLAQIRELADDAVCVLIDDEADREHAHKMMQRLGIVQLDIEAATEESKK